MIPGDSPGTAPGQDVVARGGSWYSLLTTVKLARDPGYTQPYFLSCPNDGTPFRQGPNGVWYCPWDGFRPDPSTMGAFT